MNFENYNNIYKEILDDETGDLSANYLLNKYEIKHDEELLNILSQIKKNEYISSDNKIINRLINELDENDNLLDINEIINIKDKVINSDGIDLENEDYDNTVDIKTNEIIEDKSEKSQEVINETKKNKNYLLYSLPVVIIGIAIFIFNNDTQKEITTPISKVENIKVIEESKIEKDLKKENNPIPIVEIQKESAQPTSSVIENIEAENKKIKKEIPVIVEENSNSEITLNKIEKSLPIETIEVKKESPQLDSLNDIEKYVNELEVKDDKLFFEGNYYSENNNLFGFKIFKITPLYVKFEDTNKNIRKRFLIKK
ncbi:MAG: hypothetical protein C0625_15270 [Arcobacter sp.]|nr:MAG: hypothetical protein C0625_15270 [Arcobacter sp.]